MEQKTRLVRIVYGIPSDTTTPIVPPMDLSVAHSFRDTQQLIDFNEGKLSGVKYGRYGNPTQHAAEEKIAELEDADRALLFPSGMSAVTTTVLALAKEGQHVLFTDEGNRTIRKFMTKVLPRYGIGSTAVPVDDMRNINNHIKNNTVLFFSELPTNPLLRVIDLENLVGAAKKRGITTIIDPTFATPINIRPAEYGIDLVLHSATKYLSGHHDVMAGVVAGKSDLIAEIQEYRDVFGGIIDPHASYLLHRGLQTLCLRMDCHSKNALEIARYLEKHPRVENVWYPGCESHPDYEIAEKQMSGFGGVITFSLKATEQETSRFVDSLKIPLIAQNFGGPQSTIEQHAILAFYKDRTDAEKRGITGNLLRYSTGFESPKDVIEDFENGFRSISN